MFIVYKRQNGIDYARVCVSRWKNGTSRQQTVHNLGRVIDRERSIYKNRERGIFTYDLASDSFGIPEDDFVLNGTNISRKEKLIVNFGDAWFIDQFIKKEGLDPIIQPIDCDNPDSLFSMILYYVLESAGNSHAQDWYENSYARFLYPRADLASQRVSELLQQIGSEENWRRFFKAYILWLDHLGIDYRRIIIDSTGLPNSIHFPLTAVSSHNGKISNEVRLIFVVEEEIGLPVFMRYVQGSIIDISTLVQTLRELEKYAVEPDLALVDAGYYSEKNVNYLKDNGVEFVCRVQSNRITYKKAIEENRPLLERPENLVQYNNRLLYIKKSYAEISSKYKGWIYVCKDIAREAIEEDKLLNRNDLGQLSKEEIYDELAVDGIFVMVSTNELSKEEILPVYYTRQEVEQTFDVAKNDASLLPLRIQSEENLRGHLLLVFIATAIRKLIEKTLNDPSTKGMPKKGRKLNTGSLLQNLGYQHAKVFADEIIPQEANSKANLGYRVFGIESPLSISLGNPSGKKIGNYRLFVPSPTASCLIESAREALSLCGMVRYSPASREAGSARATVATGETPPSATICAAC